MTIDAQYAAPLADPMHTLLDNALTPYLDGDLDASDDLIDALSQALNYFRRADPLEGFKALARAAARRERGLEPETPNPMMVAYAQAQTVWDQAFEELDESEEEDEPPNQGPSFVTFAGLIVR